MKGSKRFGQQSCDHCGREFTVRSSSGWECPHCGFDNKQGVERLKMMVEKAAETNKRKAAMRRANSAN